MIIKEHARKRLSDPKAVADIFREILAAEDEIDRDKEHFWVVGLDVKNGVKYIELVSLGVLAHTVVGCRETYRRAIVMAAHGILCCHNHPSNDTTPSGEDLRLTEMLKKAGDIIGIALLDHVIVGANGYTSLRDMGYV